MKTFVDTQKYSSHSLLVYGNLADRFIDSDLVLRNFDQYLVKLLKDRGWEHIIFYGSDSNRGAYCLDPESARFFFRESNGGVALPAKHEPGQKPDKADKAQPEPVKAEPVKKKVSALDRYRSKGYKPGMQPGQPAKEEPKEAEVHAAPQQDAAPPQEVTCRLDWVLDEFVRTISPMMQHRDSRMAVVFYNILSTDMSENPQLIDNLLHQWDMTDNICLLLAPGTLDHTNNLMQLLQNYRLHDKFIVRHGDHDLRPNPRTSFHIGMPGVDEVEYLLRRFALMGTRRGRRISLPFSQMKETAEAIINCISQHIASRGDAPVTTLSMSYLIDALSDVIDAQPGDAPVLLDAAMIKRLFPVSEDGEDALEAFHRRGWEAAYERMKEVAFRARKDFADRRPPERDEKPDWSIMRTEMEQYVSASQRPRVPNFLITGNPGTGKTEIARKIARMLYELGYLRTSGMKEVTREGLTSRYVNGTAEETRARVDEAEEQVLFLDEAHSLGNHDGGSDQEDPGKAVVQELNSCLTNPNRHFSLVMAGYHEPMKAVFKLDPGFSRRITYTIHIDDYEPDLLSSILQEKILSAGCTIDPELLTPIEAAPDHVTPFDCMVRRIYRERDRVNFGNAGAMVELANRVCGRTGDDCVVRREQFYAEGYDDDWFRCTDLDNSLESLLKEFRRRFVGMENIQELLCRLHRAMSDKIARGQSSEDVKLPSLILAGNPGTGKTSVCEMLARMYFGLQALGSAEVVTFKLRNRQRAREELQEAIDEAQSRKALLMIDEAHQLTENILKGTLSTLMAPMTDKAHPFMVVLCCYRTRLGDLLAEDDGLMRRFEEPIILEDYTGEELHQIFHKAMKNDDPRFTITPEADQALRDALEHVYETRTPRTGNAGFVVDKLLHGVMNDRRVKRCLDEGISLADEKSMCFTEADIPPEMARSHVRSSAEGEIDRLMQIMNHLEEDLAGYDGIRAIIEEKITSLIFNLRYPESRTVVEPGHYFFLGNAGTGKTTAAEKLAEYFTLIGLTSRRELRKFSGPDLLGTVIGETTQKVDNMLMEALGGVLLIDEAYALADGDREPNTYKRDAIAKLIAFLDDERMRRVSCVVFAGYEQDMEALYRANQGMRSRVRPVAFEDFDLEDCLNVLRIMLRKENRRLDEEALPALEELLRAVRQRPNFANGRDVRHLKDLCVQKMVHRCVHSGGLANVILAEDVPSCEEALQHLNAQTH